MLSPYTVTIYTKQDNPYNVIPDAPIEIRERLANGTSGSLSIIYSDQEGLIPITQTGAKADSNGQFVFYAEAAQYNAVYESQTVPVDIGLTADTLPSAIINNLSLPHVFDTVDSATSTTVSLPLGKSVRIKDRANAKFTVVTISSLGGSPLSGFEELELTNNPTKALILTSVLNDSKKPLILAQWGGKKSDIGDNTIGFDNSEVFQYMITYAKENAISVIKVWGGRYKVNTGIVAPNSNDGLGETTVTIQGSGENSTEIFTTTNIDIFTHGKFFNLFDLSIANRGLDGLTKYTGTATRCNGESWKCRTERVTFWWFKIAQVKRYSLWDSYRDLTYNGNLCGIKLARVSDMFDQTNPGAVGPWNRGDLDGWFHNKNTFDNIVFNGDKESSGGRGEIGFWGATEGCTFKNVTAQNYERDGTIPNQTIPLGQASTGIQLEGGGLTSTASQDNTITSMYFERTFNALKVTDQKALVINGLFTQGQAGGNILLDATRSTVNVTGQTNQSAGWNGGDIVAVDSNITFDKVIQSAGGASSRSLTNSYLSENGVPIQTVIRTSEVTITPEFTGSLSITVKTDADEIAYERIGNYVPFTGRVDVDSVTGTSASSTYIEIGGMPFSVGNATQRAGNASVNVTVFNGVNGTEMVPAILLENATAIRVFVVPSTMTGNEQFYISGHYFTTAFS